MMRCALALCIYFILKSSDARFLWPKSYTLKATLTVPQAGVVEPYQVWYDGDTKKSRVDFYDGMDKLYREFDAVNKKYQYYKIHPETTKQFTNKEVCSVMAPDDSMTLMYDQSNYLPVKEFHFQYSEFINGTKVEKWVKSYKVDNKYNANVNYNVWVRFEGGKTTAIPVRYEYELKTDDVVVDFFRHDYKFFADGKPESTQLELPLEPKYEDRNISEHESLDPLMEYVEPNIQERRINELFVRYKLKHNKSYESEVEGSRRLNIFKNNFRYIHSVNRQHRSFSLAINHLADLTDGEISVFMGAVLSEPATDDVTDDDDVEDAREELGDRNGFDWRDYGAVTRVKDQTGLCGACYAFTAAAVVESSAYIARGCKNLEELSEQAILDCSWGDTGCDGGDYTYAFTWAKKHGIPTRKEYGPYLAMEGRCHVGDMKKVAPVPEFKKIVKRNRLIRKALRERGPLAAAVDGKLRSFLFFSKGIYDDQRCRSEPDQRSHAVTVIGYGKEGDKRYWILKNTFGTTWGEGGYTRLAVDDNLCGVKNTFGTTWGEGGYTRLAVDDNLCGVKNTFGTTWGEGGYTRLAVDDNLCGVKNYLYSVNYKNNKVEKCLDE